MPLRPFRHQHSENEFFHLSSTTVKKDDDTNFDFGKVENGYVSDNIIYFYCVPLERGIALNAFFDSFKINFSKKIEKDKKEDSARDKIKEYASDLSYEITLNVPAYSAREASNNLGKITDLQRLLSDLIVDGSFRDPIGVSKLFPSRVPYFSVWFKNLITSGVFYTEYPDPVTITDKNMLNHGFICMIDEVKYEPDMDKGFFESNNYLYPKNIKLSLNLQFKVSLKTGAFTDIARKSEGLFPKDVPFFAFNANGHYSRRDSGLFPFGSGTISGFTENYGIKSYMEDMDKSLGLGGIVFKTDDMNVLDTKNEAGYDKTRVFISMQVGADTAKESNRFESAMCQRRRYVCFKGFIDSFQRSVKMSYSTNDDKSKVLGSSLVDLSTQSKLDELKFDVSFSVPSSTILEARKNCAKIGTLLRMSMKRGDANVVPTSFIEARRRLGLTDGKVKVYIPHMLEKSIAGKYVKNFDAMFESAVDLYIVNFSIDIDVEKGFFDDLSGKLWPKSFKVSLSFETDAPSKMLKNYYLNNEDSEKISYGMDATDGAGNITDDSPNKFPFAKETSNVIIFR